jgi:hypothetical protein
MEEEGFFMNHEFHESLRMKSEKSWGLLALSEAAVRTWRTLRAWREPQLRKRDSGFLKL